MKSPVVKPFSSLSYLSRGQMDLIDFSTTFPEANEPFKWLLVYQDHFTKYIRLCPLMNKSAVVVSGALLNIFWDLGAPLLYKVTM